MSLRSSAVMVALVGLFVSCALRLKLTMPLIVTGSRGFVAKVTTVPPAVLVNWVAAVGGVTVPATVFLT